MSNWADSQAYQNELNQGFKFGKYVNPGQISQFMKPTQNLISGQLDTSQQLMDPNSDINAQMRSLMESRAAESGQQQMMASRRMAAQGGMSPGQAMMNARMSMGQAMGGVNQQAMAMQQGQFAQGLGLQQNMTQMQQGLGEQYSNAYTQRIAQNRLRRTKKKKWYQKVGDHMKSNLQTAAKIGLTAAMSDKRLKKNVELVGRSSKGYNIYEFEYKDKNLGPDRYRGVMAQEVPFASMTDSDGYLFVNYSHPNLDVNFERIK
jgi:hypothetical protein